MFTLPPNLKKNPSIHSEDIMLTRFGTDAIMHMRMHTHGQSKHIMPPAPKGGGGIKMSYE